MLTDRVVVLIDGGAGSGKTSLAQLLADEWPRAVQVVSLDDLYPGWAGLSAASQIVADQVLRADSPGFHRWDWGRSLPAEWVALDPKLDLIVEGCGALTPATAARASWTIWCELPATERRRRAIERDGAAFAAHWDAWAAQESRHWAENRPAELADFIVTIESPGANSK